MSRREPMSHQQIVSLLQLLTAYDRRTVGEADVHVWHDAANRMGWPADLAFEAVKELGATSTAWIKPGHVTEWIRAQRRQPAPFEGARALPAVPPATAEHRRRVFAEFVKSVAEKTRMEDVYVPAEEGVSQS